MSRKNIGDYKIRLAEHNRKQVYEVLQKHPDAPSHRIMALTGFSQPTVLGHVRAIKAGWTPPTDTNDKAPA